MVPVNYELPSVSGHRQRSEELASYNHLFPAGITAYRLVSRVSCSSIYRLVRKKISLEFNKRLFSSVIFSVIKFLSAKQLSATLNERLERLESVYVRLSRSDHRSEREEKVFFLARKSRHYVDKQNTSVIGKRQISRWKVTSWTFGWQGRACFACNERQIVPRTEIHGSHRRLALIGRRYIDF